MGFQMFSDVELVDDTKRAVNEERRAMLAVLDRLREIHSRSLHLQLAFSSLHEFCVEELQMSDGAAHRRIQAMWLCGDLSKAKQAIADGSLSLSTAAILQKFFRSDENTCTTVDEKEALLERVKGKSKVECDRILHPNRKGTTIRFLADDDTIQMLKRLSELTAVGEKNTAALIKRVAAIALRAIDPLAPKPQTKKPASEASAPNPSAPGPSAPKSRFLAKILKTASLEKLSEVPPSRSRYIAVDVERDVWQRDGGQCTFVDPLPKRRCMSRYGLQLDHVMPLACGGPSTLENLRLLCASHNRLAAEQVFGKKKMARFKRH